MAQHKSAKKSVRQDERARVRNRSWKSRIKTVGKKLEKAIEANEVDNMKSFFNEYESTLDRAVSKGVIHKNTSSRKKMRMAQRIKGAGKAPKVTKTPVKSKEAEPEIAAVENAVDERAADEKVAGEKVADKKAAEKKPAAKKTATKKPAAKKTTARKPAAKKPASE